MELDRDRLLKMRFGKEMLHFYDEIMEKFPIYNSYFLVDKLNSVEVVTDPKTIRDLITFKFLHKPAAYDSFKNKIYLIGDDVESFHMYHELFHLLSSYNGKSKNIIYSGFSQTDTVSFKSVGNGINEGYTQVLKERYFGKTKREKGIYLMEKILMKYLEKIVGQREMEKNYLWGDVEGLIKNLCKYSNENEIAIFINNVDYIYEVSKNKDNLNNEKNVEYINMRLKDSILFLINAYIMKQTMLYHKEIISGELYKENIEKYIEDLSYPFEYKGHTYNPIKYEDIEKVLYYNSLVPANTR